ncbi:hypothetical protein NDU88_003250 [Pleurodeles waltl]|uniref:Uncharacterized protein n=1 Tax=Pleurodeles waltl TaxID=8319 RepID=A0AAV7WSK6_PLEWA|nr:hypothetical protein NDU88_003250 [Pleurodeles waltl]
MGSLAPLQQLFRQPPRGARGPCRRLVSQVPRPGLAQRSRVGPSKTRAVPASPTSKGKCLLGRGPTRAPSPRRPLQRLQRGSENRTRSPPHTGRPHRTRGGPLLHPRPRLQARGGAASLLSRQSARLGPQLHTGPRRRIGRVVGWSTARRPRSKEGQPGLARFSGVLSSPLRSELFRRAPCSEPWPRPDLDLYLKYSD